MKKIVALVCTGKNVFIAALLIALNLFAITADAQAVKMKLMAYNLLNYYSDNADSAKRNPYFRTILDATRPDVLATEELQTDATSLNFLNGVLKKVNSDYTRAPFIDGDDTNNALYFLSSRFECTSNVVIHTDVRDINRFKLVCKETEDTIYIFVVHLKASFGDVEEAARLSEVNLLRNATNSLPAGTPIIVCGDFNFYSADESGYKRLLAQDAGKDGHFYDPITMTGDWGQGIYAKYHTQSPRERNFGGGSTGGMDDRFDLILFSSSIKYTGNVRYIANSTVAYGNDGHHYNDSINHMPNTAVSQNIANALCYASDHIPVIAEFSLGNTPTAVEALPSFSSLISFYPNPVSDNLTVNLASPSEATITLFDISGRRYLQQEFKGNVNISMKGLPAGIYLMHITTQESTYTYKLEHN